MEHALVDEFRIMVFPVVLGSGKRLFREGREPPTPVGSTRGSAPTSCSYELRASWRDARRRVQAAQDPNPVCVGPPTSWTPPDGPPPGRLGRGVASWIGDRLSRGEVDRFSGRFIKHTGILATFDAPTRALRCAFGLIRSVARRGAVAGALTLVVGVAVYYRVERSAGVVGEANLGLDECRTGGRTGEWELFEASTIASDAR